MSTLNDYPKRLTWWRRLLINAASASSAAAWVRVVSSRIFGGSMTDVGAPLGWYVTKAENAFGSPLWYVEDGDRTFGHCESEAEALAIRDVLNGAGVASEAGRPDQRGIIGALSDVQRAGAALSASPAEPLTVARLAELLKEGEILCEEWLYTGHQSPPRVRRVDENKLAAWLLPRLGAVPVAPPEGP